LFETKIRGIVQSRSVTGVRASQCCAKPRELIESGLVLVKMTVRILGQGGGSGVAGVTGTLARLEGTIALGAQLRQTSVS
jgi:hypothetical protein